MSKEKRVQQNQGVGKTLNNIKKILTTTLKTDIIKEKKENNYD